MDECRKLVGDKEVLPGEPGQCATEALKQLGLTSQLEWFVARQNGAGRDVPRRQDGAPPVLKRQFRVPISFWYQFCGNCVQNGRFCVVAPV